MVSIVVAVHTNKNWWSVTMGKKRDTNYVSDSKEAKMQMCQVKERIRWHVIYTFFISGALYDVHDIWMSENLRLNNSMIPFKTIYIYTHISTGVESER